MIINSTKNSIARTQTSVFGAVFMGALVFVAGVIYPNRQVVKRF
ncbi:MAG: hypothetical protein Q8P30_00790 [Candidatus Uhrbacteria bacterium]|nr:hypothetical protein [Candidatus Uhrbacteria bacterium]